MARTKEVEEMTIPTINDNADCHHMIRKIGPRLTESGTITVDIADADVRNWLQAGYRLSFCQSLGIDPDGTNILYIFVKDGNS